MISRNDHHIEMGSDQVGAKASSGEYRTNGQTGEGSGEPSSAVLTSACAFYGSDVSAQQTA